MATTKPEYKWRIQWPRSIGYTISHLCSFYGLYLCFSAPWKTLFFSWFLLELALLGVTGGSHRLWAHKAFKAKTPLKIFFVIIQTLALQSHIYRWVNVHRLHHKHVDTDADPHNSQRGLFFSHVGWLYVQPEPEVIEKYRQIDCSDLRADKFVMFQKKYFNTVLAPVIAILIPTLIPWYCWGDSLTNSFFISAMLRYCLSIQIIGLVNSVAHANGTKPYDKNMNAVESPIVSLLSGGEGWHNYHHVFPWDYRASEWGSRINVTTAFLDCMAAIGWAYDLKSVAPEMITARALRTGDGTRKVDRLFDVKENSLHHGDDHIWGWGDKDMTEEDFSYVRIRNSRRG